MSLSKKYDYEFDGQKDQDDDNSYFTDIPLEDEKELEQRRRVRRILEDRLERKRLLNEVDELEDDFDWDDVDSER